MAASLGRDSLSTRADRQELPWGDMGDYSDSESDEEACGGPCCMILGPSDQRSATYQPGVGSFLRSSVLERPWHDLRLPADGPCLVSLPTPTPPWAYDL